MLDKPEQFGVYRGRVSNVMEFGCFVELLGFRTKAEGLVHLANMAKTRRAHRPTPDAHQSVCIVLNSCVCPPMISQTVVPMYAPQCLNQSASKASADHVCLPMLSFSYGAAYGRTELTRAAQLAVCFPSAAA